MCAYTSHRAYNIYTNFKDTRYNNYKTELYNDTLGFAIQIKCKSLLK